MPVVWPQMSVMGSGNSHRLGCSVLLQGVRVGSPHTHVSPSSAASRGLRNKTPTMKSPTSASPLARNVQRSLQHTSDSSSTGSGVVTGSGEVIVSPPHAGIAFAASTAEKHFKSPTAESTRSTNSYSNSDEDKSPPKMSAPALPLTVNVAALIDRTIANASPLRTEAFFPDAVAAAAAAPASEQPATATLQPLVSPPALMPQGYLSSSPQGTNVVPRPRSTSQEKVDSASANSNSDPPRPRAHTSDTSDKVRL